MELVQIAPALKLPRPSPTGSRPAHPWAKTTLPQATRPLAPAQHRLRKRPLPNIGECWHHKTATFMMLGNLCTRRCGFCAVPKGRPEPIDFDEPRRVAQAVSALGSSTPSSPALTATTTSSAARAPSPWSSKKFAARPRLPHRGAHPRFSGQSGSHPRGRRSSPRGAQSQHESVPRLYRVVRSGAAMNVPLSYCATPKSCGPRGSPNPASWLAWARKPPSCSRFSRSRRRPLRHPHHRPISAPLPRSPTHGPPLHAARVC